MPVVRKKPIQLPNQADQMTSRPTSSGRTDHGPA